MQLGLTTHKARQTMLVEGKKTPVQDSHVYSASRVQMHAFLISLQMTVSGQLHVPDAIIRRKAQQAVWTPSWAGEFVEDKAALSRH